ncbi:MAG: hypothetical protein Q9187_003894, partial [Circinaria calcarea]
MSHPRRNIEPLTIQTARAGLDSKTGVFAAAAFRYTEEPVAAAAGATLARSRGSINRSVVRQAAGMNGYPGATTAPPGMYVRAIYDYDADDQTSLSFRQGDIIQVLTQLKSGWWDGIIHNVRGWFPSNYCEVVSGSGAGGRGGPPATNGDDLSGDSGTEDGLEGNPREPGSTAAGGNGVSRSSTEDSEGQEQSDAAFWVPQATADGRLYYFNTLTGVSAMELPLEAPTSANETGPWDRMNILVPDQTRPPPEMMAQGYQREEDDDCNSASEAEGEPMMLASNASLSGQRRSYIFDAMSPSASTESLTASPVLRTRNDSHDLYTAQYAQVPGQLSSGSTAALMNTTSSFTGNVLGQAVGAVSAGSFFDDGNSPPLTWGRLVENMQRSVESYRQAINNADRSEYVRKAEDISDHLRMLLAAGSGTTDNHSGNPSIISTNKALYPHFRDMMSRFSKLVLSSHIAAADWPAPDSYAKCLQEAEGVMRGVHSYVEVAQAQRGDEIPRLTPGFILGSRAGGSWQNNNLSKDASSLSTSFMDQYEYDSYVVPSLTLDRHLLERMDDMKRLIVSSIRQLDEHLIVTEKIITPFRHEQIGSSICTAAGKVIYSLKPYISTVESINLSPLGSPFQNPQLTDFAAQKQRLYDLVANLLIACQAVAAPLSDEWADVRGEPLENRVQDVRNVTKLLETSVSQVSFSLQLLMDNISEENSAQKHRDMPTREARRRTDGDVVNQTSHLRDNPKALQRPQLTNGGHSTSYSEGIDPTTENCHTENPKVKKFFGEVPTPNRDSEETPSFLRLDHEGEISYDTKVTPPQLRGGTLTALVEQLTRHDRFDSPFKITFLLTYRSFTTAAELFEMLVKRFSIQPPRGISQEDYQTWVDKKQKPIRIRVVNVLKSWFDNYWMENNDHNSDELLRRVYSFAKDSIATTSTPGSGPLMIVVEQRLRGQDANTKRIIPTLSTSTPTPIMPKNMKKLKFLDIDVTEFARQLTIIESRLYGKIKPTECLNKTWQKKLAPDEPEPAPNVKALILHSNQLTNWVAEMILTQSDVKRRVVVIKHFVAVAD